MEILRHCVAFNTGHKNRMDTEGWWGMGLGEELSENRCNLFFCFATTSNGRGHPAPSASVFVGLVKRLTRGKACREIKGSGWEGGRIAVNTSSNDLHNIRNLQQLHLCAHTEVHCSDKAQFCECLRPSSVSSAETLVDPRVWCYQNKQWNSFNNHYYMEANWHARSHANTHTQTSTHTIAQTIFR